jgi:hypothetical protein
MPDQHERHGRSKWEWGTPGARSQERAAAARDDPARSQVPGKKDSDLCKGAHWKAPHQPELQLRQPGWRRSRPCEWDISWRDPDKPSWYCAHEEVCSGCGKILRTGIEADECPRYHPITDAERAALDVKRAERETRVAAARGRWRPKPPITGPQGYRKPSTKASP